MQTVWSPRGHLLILVCASSLAGWQNVVRHEMDTGVHEHILVCWHRPTHRAPCTVESSTEGDFPTGQTGSNAHFQVGRSLPHICPAVLIQEMLPICTRKTLSATITQLSSINRQAVEDRSCVCLCPYLSAICCKNGKHIKVGSIRQKGRQQICRDGGPWPLMDGMCRSTWIGAGTSASRTQTNSIIDNTQ